MLPPPSSNVSTRPTPLVAGALICGVAVLATIVEGAFWIAFWTDLSNVATEQISDPEAEEIFGIYRNLLLVVVTASGLLSFSTMAGAIMAMAGKNAGRIMVWVSGGLVAAWHICCSGYSLILRAVFSQAAAESTSSGNDNPLDDIGLWMVDAAVITGFVAAVAALVAIILIAQSSVNAYFRALKPPRPMPQPPHNPYGYPPQGPYMH